MTEKEIKAIFGSDTNRLLRACKAIMHDWLYPYEGCYCAPHPNFKEVREMLGKYVNGAQFIKERKKILDVWYNEHPEEAKKEEMSRKQWKHRRDKEFKTVYGIAKRHGVYLLWYGKDGACQCGDQWEVLKGHESIGRICM